MMTWNISSLWKKVNEDFGPSLSTHSSLDIYALNTNSKDKTSNIKQVKKVKSNKSFNFFHRAPSNASSAMKSKTPTLAQAQTLGGKDSVTRKEKGKEELRRVKYFDYDVKLPYLSSQPRSYEPHPPMMMLTPPTPLSSTVSCATSTVGVGSDVLPVDTDAKGVMSYPIVDNCVQNIAIVECDVEENLNEELEGIPEEMDITDGGRSAHDVISTRSECRTEKSLKSSSGSGKNDEDSEEDLSTHVIDTGNDPSFSQVFPDDPNLSAHSIKSFEESQGEFVSISLSMSYINVDKGSVPDNAQTPIHQTARLDNCSSLFKFPSKHASGNVNGIVSFQDFKIKHNVGSGAYGRVFRAEHRQLNTVHAIKLIPKRKCWTLYEREFVLEERRILARLAEAPKMYKDFFLTLDASFHDSVYFFFVTPFVAGGDLMKVWKNCGSRFPVERVRIYAAELLHAIEFLHANRICHRDIKLENVFIDDKGHLVLGDFGLARLFADKDPEDKLEDKLEDEQDSDDTKVQVDVLSSQEKSSDGMLNSAISYVPSLDSEKALEKALEYEGKDLSQSPAGTPGHMAPEILWKKAYSYPVDIWSLGVIMFQMLFGELPFWGCDKREVNRNTVHEELVIPEDPNVDNDTKDILVKMMAKAPMLRPDATSLKMHPFFKSIDWKLIAKRKNKLDWHSSKPDSRATVHNKCLPSEIHVEVGEPSDDGLYDEDVAAFTYTSNAFKEKLLKKNSTRRMNYLQAVLNRLKRIFLRRKDEVQVDRCQSVEGDRQRGSVIGIASPIASIRESSIGSGTGINKPSQSSPVYSHTSYRPQRSSPDTSTTTSSSGNSLWYKVSSSWLRLSRGPISIRSPDTSLSSASAPRGADSTLYSSPPPPMSGKVPMHSYADSDSSVIWRSLTRWTSHGNNGSKERWNWSRLTLKLSRINLRAEMQLAN